MANSPNALAGIAYVTIDGQTTMLAGDLTYSPSSVQRETLIGQDRIHGFSIKPRAPFISGTFRDSLTLTVEDFSGKEDVTVTLELTNGKVVIGRDMWVVETQDVKTQEATFEVKFEGFSGSITET